MNWRETLIFPPEMPISDNARNLIDRYVHTEVYISDCLIVIIRFLLDLADVLNLVLKLIFSSTPCQISPVS